MDNIQGIACSIFKEAITKLQQEGKITIPFTYIDSHNHMHPEKLEAELDALIQKDEKTLLVFGDCHANMVDLETNENISRVKGMNCVEVFLGSEQYRELVRQGAFFLLHEWTRRWEKVFKDWLGLNEKNAKDFMHEMHSQLIYVDIGLSPIPEKELEKISKYCDLPYSILKTDLQHIEKSIQNSLKKFQEIDKHNEPRTRAYDFLVVDLVEKLLTFASSSEQCSKIIAQTIRELIGVKAVAVIEHEKNNSTDKDTLLSIEPARRKKQYESADINALISEIKSFDEVEVLDKEVPNNVLTGFLSKYSIEKIGVLPLKVSAQRIGSILLLDLYDDRNIQAVLESIKMISSIIALILQNSNIIDNLESIIDVRTSELELSKERAELITRTVPNGIFTVDTDRIVTSWNPMSEKITGYAADEIIGQSCSVFAINTCGDVCRVFDEGKSILGAECIIRCKDGTEKHVLKNTDLLRDKQGNIIGAIESFEDISERLENQRKVKDSEMKFKSLYEYMNEGICLHELVYDETGTPINYKIIDVNKKYETSLGLNKQTIQNQLATNVYKTKEAPYLKEYAEVVKTKKPFSFQTYFEPLDKHFYISAFSPEKDRFATVFLDITDRIKAEEALNLNRDRLKTANSILRHDITNDFVVIQSAVDIFRDEQDESLLDEIEKRVQMSLDTIAWQREHENFLSEHAELDEYDIRNVIEKVLSKYSYLDSKINGKGAVFADRAIYSVIGNIVSNAVKHGRTNKLDVTISDEDNFCVVRIADSGIGIPDEIKSHIFHKGFHYGPAGHTGIGLYIVQKTMDEYGGEVYVEDNKPKGTVIILKMRKVIHDIAL
ncbi:MAG: DUF1638 domain-containing protein [Candidatus Cloacimonetes bacterium]|nr:DUF1638 domain-containing protein [Candidatus Cloacimonadota bacterium]